MDAALLIVAAGRGNRMQTDSPKQFLPLLGKPVLMHTLTRMHQVMPGAPLILILHPDDRGYWESLCKKHQFQIPHQVTCGGRERYHSVQLGLTYLQENYKLSAGTLIGIHDGVRPLIDAETIQGVFNAARISGAAVPAIESRDSLRIRDKDGKTRSLPRKDVFSVQTPQVFRADLLLPAYQSPYQAEFTDDAAVIQNSGYDIALVAGHIQNIKITYPMDILLAEILLRAKPL